MSVLGREAAHRPEADQPIKRHDACYLCDKPIEDGQESVDGISISAHRACIDAKLDKLNPRWRELTHDRGNGKGKADAADNP